MVVTSNFSFDSPAGLVVFVFKITFDFATLPVLLEPPKAFVMLPPVMFTLVSFVTPASLPPPKTFLTLPLKY